MESPPVESPSAVREEAPAFSAPRTRPAPAVGERDWPEIVAQLGLQGMAAQLAANCVMSGRNDGQITLSISQQHATLRSASMEQRLQEALSGYFGRPMRVEFVVGEVVAATPADIRLKQAEDRQQAAVDAIHADPNVQRICDTFGARVVPESIRPID